MEGAKDEPGDEALNCEDGVGSAYVVQLGVVLVEKFLVFLVGVVSCLDQLVLVSTDVHIRLKHRGDHNG